MATLKTIAIIGVGEKKGSAIARTLSRNSYRLLLIADEYENALSLKKELEDAGTSAELVVMECAKEASWEADIIILATRRETEREVAEKIRKVSIGKVVISSSIPGTSEYGELLMAPNQSAAEDLQKLLPYSKIVKIFNIYPAAQHAGVNGDRSELLIVGNSDDAVDAVADMAKAAGYRPTVVGDPTASRTSNDAAYQPCDPE